MLVANTIAQTRIAIAAARSAGKTIGLVPTMGALHVGHISLIKAACQQCDFVVVSIFVNPTQFGPSEDFDKYPRPIEKDLDICRENGVDLVLNPSPAEMYPAQQLTWINVEKIAEPLCGRSRPSHFRGVATVCTKLFNITTPDKAFFGQKDAQQVAVIKRMVADLNMPLEIIVCPTVREPDGLAMSSRNKYLSPEHRALAPGIYKALCLARDMIHSGQTSTAAILAATKAQLAKEPLIELEYLNIVDPYELCDLETLESQALVIIAARIGTTRLIDNILVDLTA